MTFLIRQGLPKKQAFKIMESVRKGRGLVPDGEFHERGRGTFMVYRIMSKIKYMFPGPTL